jgi:hypothetical protein
MSLLNKVTPPHIGVLRLNSSSLTKPFGIHSRRIEARVTQSNLGRLLGAAPATLYASKKAIAQHLLKTR